jgi:hypothetical protein
MGSYLALGTSLEKLQMLSKKPNNMNPLFGFTSPFSKFRNTPILAFS